MSIVTHQDVVNYLLRVNGDQPSTSTYEIKGNKLHIYKWYMFHIFQYKTLPRDMVFHEWCDLDGSDIESLPDDIKLYDHISLQDCSITKLPVLNIGGYLDIADTETIIADGTYIHRHLFSRDSNYSHYDHTMVNGYFFSTGVLS